MLSLLRQRNWERSIVGVKSLVLGNEIETEERSSGQVNSISQ